MVMVHTHFSHTGSRMPVGLAATVIRLGSGSSYRS